MISAILMYMFLLSMYIQSDHSAEYGSANIDELRTPTKQNNNK